MIPGIPAPDAGSTMRPDQAEVEGIVGDGEAPEQTPPEGGEGTPEPEPEAQPQQEAGTPGAEGEQPAPEDEGPKPGEEGYLWAGRYKTPQDMERGIQDIKGLQSRTAAEANRLRAQLQQAAQYVQQVVAWQRQQQQGQQPQPAQPGGDIDEDTLKVLQPLIDQRVDQVRQELTQGLQQQKQQEAAQKDQEERQGAVDAFFNNHPDLVRDGEEDAAITGVLHELGWGPYAEELEIAFQIAQDPALREVISAIPSLADTDEGLAFARKAAGQPPATPQQRAGTEAQRRAATRAHVEKGGGAAPVTAKPKDEVDEMLAEGQKGKANIFGIIPT